MCAVHHDAFEMLEIGLNHFEKDITYVRHVQSKSVIKDALNYNNNITVNDM